MENTNKIKPNFTNENENKLTNEELYRLLVAAKNNNTEAIATLTTKHLGRINVFARESAYRLKRISESDVNEFKQQAWISYRYSIMKFPLDEIEISEEYELEKRVLGYAKKSIKNALISYAKKEMSGSAFTTYGADKIYETENIISENSDYDGYTNIGAKELATEMNVKIKTAQKYISSLQLKNLCSIEDNDVSKSSLDPVETYAKKEFRKILYTVITENFNDNDQFIIIETLFNNRNFVDIDVKLGRRKNYSGDRFREIIIPKLKKLLEKNGISNDYFS